MFPLPFFLPAAKEDAFAVDRQVSLPPGDGLVVEQQRHLVVFPDQDDVMPVIQGHIQGVVPKDVPKDKPSPDVAFRNRLALIPFVQRQLKPIDRVARKENLTRTFFVKAIQPGPD